jgi:flagellar biosynthesis GTPase FlhF
LQFGAYGLQEAPGSGTIQDAMVERETEIHHVTYGDRIILDYNRPFDNCIHTKNPGVRLIDNRH